MYMDIYLNKRGNQMNERNCKFCGKTFMPKTNNQLYCEGPHFMKCPICDKQYQVNNNNKLKYLPTACSYKCRTIKRTETSLEKYGCIAPGNNPEARKKASETMMKNFGVPYAMMSPEIKKKSKETLLKKYDVDNIMKSKEFAKKYRKSKQIKKSSENKSNRILIPIEHRIYARNCKLFVLYQEYAQEFLNQYSIYPVDNEKKLHLGLLYQNELIQIMSFREYKENKKYDYELVHLCTKPGYQIIGGASKLFYFATHQYEMNNIVAFCDLSKFQGNVFEKIGMHKVKNIPPVKYWSMDDICIPHSAIDKKFILDMFGIKLKSKSDIEDIMMDSLWIPIYDCGHTIFEYIK